MCCVQYYLCKKKEQHLQYKVSYIRSMYGPHGTQESRTELLYDMCVRMYIKDENAFVCVTSQGLSLSVLSQLLKGRASHSTTNSRLYNIEIGEIAPRCSSDNLFGDVESKGYPPILEGVIWNRKPLARWRFYSFR